MTGTWGVITVPTLWVRMATFSRSSDTWRLRLCQSWLGGHAFQRWSWRSQGAIQLFTHKVCLKI